MSPVHTPNLLAPLDLGFDVEKPCPDGVDAYNLEETKIGTASLNFTLNARAAASH